MPAGRPTTFNEEIALKAREYLSDDKEVNYLSHGHAIPSQQFTDGQKIKNMNSRTY
jgi:hypothetical protein